MNSGPEYNFAGREADEVKGMMVGLPHRGPFPGDLESLNKEASEKNT